MTDTPTTDALIAELRALMAKATPGPLYLSMKQASVPTYILPGLRKIVVRWAPNDHRHDNKDANAALIVAAINALPALLDLATPRAGASGEREALAGYRAAVSFISSDAWDGCSDCIEILKAARAADWNNDQAADLDATARELKRIRLHGAALTRSEADEAPGVEIPAGMARAYFERGFIASYAWSVTKAADAKLSDDVMEHAWAHRDEGMDAEDLLPPIAQPVASKIKVTAEIDRTLRKALLCSATVVGTIAQPVAPSRDHVPDAGDMVAPLREAVARIIDPLTWQDRDAYVRIMTTNGGCDHSVVREIADRRVRDSLAAADAILALTPDAAKSDAVRLRGQNEGFAAAVQWLRDRSATKPPASLSHAATVLADDMEQSRIAALATPTAPSDQGTS